MPDEAALRLAQDAPLTFGPWRELKALYKRLEADPSADPEVLGTLISRLDCAPLTPSHEQPLVRLGRVYSIQALAAQGDLLAIGLYRYSNAPYIGLYDFSGPDKLNPKQAGMVKAEPGAQIAQLLWCGPLLVVRQGEKVHVYEPERQELKRLATLSVSALDVAASFPFLYVVVKDALRIIDLRNVTGAGVQLDLRGAKKVVLGEKLAVVLTEAAGVSWNRLPSAGGLKVVDLRDPARPTVAQELDCKHGRKIAIAKSLLYAYTRQNNYGEGKLRVYELTSSGRARELAMGDVGSARDEVGLLPVGEGVYLSASTLPLGFYELGSNGKVQRHEALQRRDGQLAVSAEWLFIADWLGLSLWNITHPQKPGRFGTPPSPRTLGYMKRRARRHLKALAKTAPERFVEMAYHVLKRAPEELSPTFQWVSLELLFGGSGRFLQQSHGRGRLNEKVARGLVRRHAEARASEAWASRPELAKALLTQKAAHWAVRELAVQALHAAKVPLPKLSNGVLEDLLESPSLLLIAEAVRQVERATPDVAALAFSKAVAWQRTRLAALIVEQAQDAKWKVAFAEKLMAVTATTGRRFAATAALLATHFSESMGGEQVLRLVPGLLATGKPELRALVFSAAATVDEGTLEDWLALLAGLSESDREALLVALEAGVAGKDLGEPWELVESAEALLREATWRLLAASATSAESLRALWDDILDAPSLSPTLLTAMRSTYALTTLGRAGFTAQELAELLRERPFLVGLLTVEAFSSLTQTLPMPILLRLVSAADDDAWGRLRDGWLRNLREGLGVRELWTALPAALKEDNTGRIGARVLTDSAIAEVLLTESEAHVLLELREPALGPLLGRWLVRHWPQVESNEGLLLLAATHPLPDLRTAALELAARRTLSLAFALRLLECEIPASVTVGKRWFTDANQDRLLALCDSPVASVRAFGREQIRAKRETLDIPALCTALFEHDAPDMQAFAAELAGDTPAPQFDRAVLRTRHKARRAKEQVKQRQERAEPLGQVDLPTLLALARGTSTPRDAEWALSQLAKRALAGEKIDGLEIG